MLLTTTTLLCLLHLSIIHISEAIECLTLSKESGEIYEYPNHEYGFFRKEYITHHRCYFIQVPEDSWVKISIENIVFHNMTCSEAYVRISVADTEQPYEFCSQDVENETITAYSDVNITYFHGSLHKGSLVHLKYHTETSIPAIKGVNSSREKAISWLKSKRTSSLGWDKETPRAITALYLAGATNFHGENLEDELMVNQLELQATLALLRNSSDPLTVNELSMFINALRVTCHNPQDFYGYNFLKILSERLSGSSAPNVGAYLTLCTSNWTIPETNIRKLLKILHTPTGHPFYTDVQGMAVMTLSCIKIKTNFFEKDVNSSKLLDTTVRNLMTSQLPDGTFGNIYSTALITQALLSSGQERDKTWNMVSAVKSLMFRNLTSIDLISTSLILPVLNGKSLTDIATVDCKKQRKQNRDDKISDVLSKIGARKQIQYSLYVGDKKDVMHTIYLRVPVNSSAFDLMKLAAKVDSKYEFAYSQMAGNMYVYRIAEISNDPEAGKFWHLYFGESSGQNRGIHLRAKSPDKFFLTGGDHLVMWYKTDGL